jgi:hypothetical protein
MRYSSRNFSFSIFNALYELIKLPVFSTRTVGKSTRYFNGSTKKDSALRNPSIFELLCSDISKTIETITATIKRVLIDGPVENKSFMGVASNKKKDSSPLKLHL